MVDILGLWGTIAHGIGCLVLCKIFFEIFQFVNACFLRPGKDLKKCYGEWALVTGATDGIGKAVAMELSRKGQKVLLVSRNPERLQETLKELPGPGGDVCAIDFGDFDKAKRDTLKKAMEGKDIGVVVNNVGISYEHPEFFHELDEQRVEQLIKLNVDSTTWVTHMALPKMVEKKKGAVVRIASVSALLSNPLLAEYSAAKKFVVQLSNGLYGEYAAKGIHFQVQTPGFVTSKLSKIRNSSLTTPNPENYAKVAVRAIGYEREISPFWAHYVMCAFMNWASYAVGDFISMKMHLPLRAKALKKKQKDN